MVDNESVEEEEKSIFKEKNVVINSTVQMQNQMRPGNPSSRDTMETCIIKNLISSYYSVIKKNICDYVPKTVMCFLVNQSKVMSEKEMVSQLYNSNDLESLLEEDPNIAKKRKYIKEILLNLKYSLDSLNDFKDMKLND